MIHHRCIQGSEEWLRLHFGVPSAGAFEKIITPVKWEPTKGDARRNYLLWLLTELILDTPLTGVTTASMQHGHDWEPKARAWYEMQHGIDVELAGFCTTDDGRIGASPDGFVGEDGLLEIKCPEKPEIHCGYMLAPETLKQAYFVQTQGQLYVTGREWTDLVSYFGGMPTVCERVRPVEEFHKKLHDALTLFVNDLALYIGMAKARGWIKEASTAPDHSRDFVTDADVEAILTAQREGRT